MCIVNQLPHKREGFKMKKWYDYLTDAKQIDELNNSMSELARSEHKELSDYSQGEYVATAKNLLDIMEDWEGQCDGRKLRKQRRLPTAAMAFRSKQSMMMRSVN